MILNLFTIFDFYTKSFYSLNWISTIIGLLLIFQIFWIKKSRLIYFIIFLLNMLWIEFKIIIKNKFNLFNIIFFICLFIFILLNNFLGLFSYIFTRSRHLVFSLRISLSIWIGLIFFGWIKNIKFIFSHLLPIGTPFGLIFFIVLIETLSNIIRPLTLSIRLTANIIAGHLLLTLLRRFIPNVFIIYIIFLVLQILLLILEIAVSVIQSYVFVILLILYLKETN